MNKVLLFDCDGVLGDTERNGHLPAFNQMWVELEVPWLWTVEEYGRKLKIGGGKERMASLFDDPDFRAVFDPPSTQEQRDALVKVWHQRKSAIYKGRIASGKIPPRPGVKRLAEEALAHGWILGVCSTSAKESVETVLRHCVGRATAERFALVLAGDMVKAKKPSPEIYIEAARELGVSPADCIVIEDSRNGLLAAHRAQMKCVVTTSGYTREEDFSEAAIVLTCLGDADGEKSQVIANRCGITVRDWLTAGDLEWILASAVPA